MNARVALVTTVCVTGALVASACEPVAIYGRLEPEGEPVLVVPGEGWTRPVGVGLLDGDVLVEWARVGPDDYTSIPTVQWLDAEFEALAEPLELGVGIGYMSRWLRDGDALVGQVWATPTFRTDLRANEWIHLWRLRPPPGASTYEQVQVEATIPPEGFGIVWLSAPGLGVGAEGALPLAAIGSRFVGAFGVLPRECDDISIQRLETFTSDELAGRPRPRGGRARTASSSAPRPRSSRCRPRCAPAWGAASRCGASFRRAASTRTRREASSSSTSTRAALRSVDPAPFPQASVACPTSH